MFRTFCPLSLVFPPALKKGMVKLPGKGHFKRMTTGLESTLERAVTGQEGTFKRKFEFEDIAKHKCMSLSMMQLLFFLLKSKLNGSFWTPMNEHTLIC